MGIWWWVIVLMGLYFFPPVWVEPDDILIARARFHALNFDYDAAMTDIDNVIDRDPENAELYLIRGQIRMLLYEWDAVMHDYNTALELDANYADAYYARGVLFYTVAGVGDSDVNALKKKAIDDFERYLTLAPDGLHAAEATQYIEQIQGELAALER
jgi:tetratricopeptide (TPR) repeat protein